MPWPFNKIFRQSARRVAPIASSPSRRRNCHPAQAYLARSGQAVRPAWQGIALNSEDSSSSTDSNDEHDLQSLVNEIGHIRKRQLSSTAESLNNPQYKPLHPSDPDDYYSVMSRLNHIVDKLLHDYRDNGAYQYIFYQLHLALAFFQHHNFTYNAGGDTDDPLNHFRRKILRGNIINLKELGTDNGNIDLSMLENGDQISIIYGCIINRSRCQRDATYRSNIIKHIVNKPYWLELPALARNNTYNNNHLLSETQPERHFIDVLEQTLPLSFYDVHHDLVDSYQTRYLYLFDKIIKNRLQLDNGWLSFKDPRGRTERTQLILSNGYIITHSIFEFITEQDDRRACGFLQFLSIELDNNTITQNDLNNLLQDQRFSRKAVDIYRRLPDSLNLEPQGMWNTDKIKAFLVEHLASYNFGFATHPDYPKSYLPDIELSNLFITERGYFVDVTKHHVHQSLINQLKYPHANNPSLTPTDIAQLTTYPQIQTVLKQSAREDCSQYGFRSIQPYMGYINNSSILSIINSLENQPTSSLDTELWPHKQSNLTFLAHNTAFLTWASTLNNPQQTISNLIKLDTELLEEHRFLERLINYSEHQHKPLQYITPIIHPATQRQQPSIDSFTLANLGPAINQALRAIDIEEGTLSQFFEQFWEQLVKDENATSDLSITKQLFCEVEIFEHEHFIDIEGGSHVTLASQQSEQPTLTLKTLRDSNIRIDNCGKCFGTSTLEWSRNNNGRHPLRQNDHLVTRSLEANHVDIKLLNDLVKIKYWQQAQQDNPDLITLDQFKDQAKTTLLNDPISRFTARFLKNPQTTLYPQQSFQLTPQLCDDINQKIKQGRIQTTDDLPYSFHDLLQKAAQKHQDDAGSSCCAFFRHTSDYARLINNLQQLTSRQEDQQVHAANQPSM